MYMGAVMTAGESGEGIRARLLAAKKRERERVDYLVLGQKRPMVKVTQGKRHGKRRPRAVDVPIELQPGIEEAMQLRERWSHKAYGTPETWEAASKTHQGALAQLHLNGTIDNEELEWAAQIANVHRSIGSDVDVAIASLEARVDQSRTPATLVTESIYRVRMHLAYGYWRRKLPMPKRLVLDMIVGDTIGYTVAARRYGIHSRKAKRLLIEAIKRWPECVDRACKLFSKDDLEDARRAAE